MGGHLLHHWGLPEKRVDITSFREILTIVVSGLAKELPSETRIAPLLFFRDKEDFGDLDILVEIPPSTITPSPNPWKGKKSMDWNLLIKETFGYEPFHNGMAYSFPCKDFQVDLILVAPEIYDCAYTYYAYESGNIMGRVARVLEFKYGHRGLYLQVPLHDLDPELPEDQYREILVTRDPEAIFSTLGFSHKEFQYGFQNFQEMAQWVAQSKYFDPEIFSLENLDHQTRTRNRKRPVYHEFLEFCKTAGVKRPRPSKEELRWAYTMIPNVRASYEQIRAEVSTHKVRKAKFNGTLVTELTKLEKADLGKFMVSFKVNHGAVFEEWLDSKSLEEIKQAIITYYENSRTDKK